MLLNQVDQSDGRTADDLWRRRIAANPTTMNPAEQAECAGHERDGAGSCCTSRGHPRVADSGLHRRAVGACPHLVTDEDQPGSDGCDGTPGERGGVMVMFGSWSPVGPWRVPRGCLKRRNQGVAGASPDDVIGDVTLKPGTVTGC